MRVRGRLLVTVGVSLSATGLVSAACGATAPVAVRAPALRVPAATAAAPRALVARRPRWRFLFGDTHRLPGTLSARPGAAAAFAFRDAHTGVAHTITVYVRAATTARRLAVGLYAGRGRGPGPRMRDGSISVPDGGGWVTVAIPAARMTAGAVYWVAVLGLDGTLRLAASHGAGCAAVGAAVHELRAVPRRWPAGARRATCVSAYASGVRTGRTSPPNRAPVNTSPPTIGGTADAGTRLSAGPGAWTQSPTSYAYQWQVCASPSSCAAIPGATGARHTVQAANAGDTFDVVVTATNRLGSTKAVSPRTRIVAGQTGQSVAFWLAWSGTLQESQIPWNAVTQVDLFALTTTTRSRGCASDCTRLDTALNGIDHINVPAWVSAIHRQGKLAMISIGGSTDQDWADACSARNLPGFVKRLITYVVTNGFDGVDVDIESLSGSGHQLALWSACERAIARAAHQATTRAGRTPVVSADVDQSWMDPAVARFSRSPDQFNLMYYGYPTGSYSCADACAQVNALVAGLAAVGHVPHDRMVLGMSSGGDQDQCCYLTLARTAATVDTGGPVSAIPLSQGLPAALPAGRIVLATPEDPPAHDEIFTTAGAPAGATSIPVSAAVSGTGAYAFAPGADVQSDYAGPWDCGNFAAYAASAGLEGVMMWDLQEEAAEHAGQFPCLAQIAPYVSSAPWP